MTRRKRNNPEERFQFVVSEMLRLSAVPNLIWYGVINQGKRSPAEGKRLKRIGMKAGVPDIAIVLPGGHAAFMELKTPVGILSDEQRAFYRETINNGCLYAVCRTPEEAADVLHSWGALRSNPLARAA